MGTSIDKIPMVNIKTVEMSKITSGLGSGSAGAAGGAAGAGGPPMLSSRGTGQPIKATLRMEQTTTPRGQQLLSSVLVNNNKSSGSKVMTTSTTTLK